MNVLKEKGRRYTIEAEYLVNVAERLVEARDKFDLFLEYVFTNCKA